MKNPLESPSVALDGVDPLSQFAKESNDITLQENRDSNNIDKPKKLYNVPLITHLEPWSTKRSAILMKYTTSEKLSIITSFLSDGEISKNHFFNLCIKCMV